jgi:hypothetical protein
MLRVSGPNAVEIDAITVALGELLGPAFELRPRPFEPVVRMPEPVGAQVFEEDVVLAVGRGDDDRARPRMCEQRRLEGGQTVRVHVLDNLDHGCCVEPSETVIAVHQGALQQLNALPLKVRYVLQPQAVGRPGEHPRSHLHTDHAGERAFSEEALQELPLAAAEIDDGQCASLGQLLGNTVQPLVVEPKGTLERILQRVALRRGLR